MTAGSWTVRDAHPRELREIVALERGIATAPHWRRSAYESIVQPPGAGHGIERRLLVVPGPDGLLGFSVGSLTGAAGELGGEIGGELETVAVAPSTRRLGVGRALCQAVLDWCRDRGAAEVTLEVRSGSPGPIALYRSLGFAIAGRRPGYYTDPPDAALRMRLDLRPPFR